MDGRWFVRRDATSADHANADANWLRHLISVGKDGIETLNYVRVRTKTFTTATVRLSDDLRMKEPKRATTRPPPLSSVSTSFCGQSRLSLLAKRAIVSRLRNYIFVATASHQLGRGRHGADQSLTLIHTSHATRLQFCHCEVGPRLSPALPCRAPCESLSWCWRAAPGSRSPARSTSGRRRTRSTAPPATNERGHSGKIVNSTRMMENISSASLTIEIRTSSTLPSLSAC